jgi:hypothetical protein
MRIHANLPDRRGALLLLLDVFLPFGRAEFERIQSGNHVLVVLALVVRDVTI